ncbi:hypothetical protein HMN09_01095400 [Mycena chlorophos]|uniref:F-box domain-containing protein n=1 Tax=Mycena chlorophos TaxID=658473 RepID=A0A8H6SCK6_MYCCL|nr:hypothetical protein HMN09_01095400 [Mycena chlorophos]
MTVVGARNNNTLLNLPPEILLACVLYLPIHDIAACLRVYNRVLCGVITSSVLIRYLIELELAGVHENPDAAALKGLSTAEKLALLRKRETAWETLTPSRRRAIALPGRPWLYEVIAGNWIIADDDSPDGASSSKIYHTNLAAAATAEPAPDMPPWQGVSLTLPFVNFHAVFQEHDLLIALSCVPVPNSPETIMAEAHLLSLSTGKPHPRASLSPIPIHGLPSDVFIEVGAHVCGDRLAIACIYDIDTELEGQFAVYDWQTGELLMQPGPIDSVDLVFLTPDLLLVPRLESNALYIYELPAAEPPARGVRLPVPIEFRLPPLKRGIKIVTEDAKLRVAPFASGSRRDQSPAPFVALAEESILLLSYATEPPIDSEQYDFEDYFFVILVEKLLGVYRRRTSVDQLRLRTFPEVTVPVEWDGWGPNCVRWMDPVVSSSPDAWITGSSGSRLLSYAAASAAADANEPGPTNVNGRPRPIRLLDFNPRKVAQVRRQLRLAQPSDSNTAGVRIVEPGAPSAALVAKSFQHFADPQTTLASNIAYVERTSDEMFPYRHVYMSEECIVGATALGREDQLQGFEFDTLDILHFG